MSSMWYKSVTVTTTTVCNVQQRCSAKRAPCQQEAGGGGWSFVLYTRSSRPKGRNCEYQFFTMQHVQRPGVWPQSKRSATHLKAAAAAASCNGSCCPTIPRSCCRRSPSPSLAHVRTTPTCSPALTHMQCVKPTSLGTPQRSEERPPPQAAPKSRPPLPQSRRDDLRPPAPRPAAGVPRNTRRAGRRCMPRGGKAALTRPLCHVLCAAAARDAPL